MASFIFLPRQRNNQRFHSTHRLTTSKQLIFEIRMRATSSRVTNVLRQIKLMAWIRLMRFVAFWKHVHGG